MFRLRHPALWSYEYPPIVDNENKLSPKARQYRNFSHIYQKRWEDVAAIKPSLYELVLEGEVIWDISIREKYEKIFKLEFQVQQAISDYVQENNPDNTGGKIPRSPYAQDRCDDTDVYRNEFLDLLSQIEKEIKPKLKVRNTGEIVLTFLFEKAKSFFPKKFQLLMWSKGRSNRS